MKLNVSQLISENPSAIAALFSALGAIVIAAATQLNNEENKGN